MNPVSIASPMLIAGFAVVVLAMLAIDLGVFHRRAHEVRFREALSWSIVWVVVSLCFAAVVYRWAGSQSALEFLTGYVVEKALSVDNIFIFVLIFAAFRVPAAYQHRVLFWGVFGALLMRGAFIAAGAALVQRFHWVLYAFGALLVVTAFKLLLSTGEHAPPQQNALFRLIQRVVPAVSEYDGQHFVTVRNGRRYATPLLMVLLLIETTDLVFAIDSIPAVFAVTTDPFIVFSSNVFAILGLRAMYFVLAGFIDRFRYIKHGLAAILAFVGVKMLLSGLYKIPIGVSLSVIAVILAIAVGASLLANAKESRTLYTAFAADAVGRPDRRPASTGACDRTSTTSRRR